MKQELSYRKQIARQLRTQYADDNPVTLKSRITGHSRSLETEPLRSHTTHYWTLNIIVTLKHGSEVTQGH